MGATNLSNKTLLAQAQSLVKQGFAKLPECACLFCAVEYWRIDKTCDMRTYGE
jgi:hypothetical protein